MIRVSFSLNGCIFELINIRWQLRLTGLQFFIEKLKEIESKMDGYARSGQQLSPIAQFPPIGGAYV